MSDIHTCSQQRVARYVAQRATHVVIDSNAYRHNLARVRSMVPKARIMAVIKADAYGHGMEAAAVALQDADEFGVTSLDDAHRLRKQGIGKTLTLLSSRYASEDWYALSENNLRPVVYDVSQLADVYCLDQRAKLDLWLKVDTGMGRLGLPLEEASEAIERLKNSPGVRSLSLMTHLANADDPKHWGNQHQFNAFEALCARHAPRDVSILNSAGTVAFSHHAGDVVRTGLILYGISPLSGRPAEEFNVLPVMTLKSELISLRTMPAGTCIGYGSTYTLQQDSRIGVVSCGYGDGYPRHAPSGTPVLVNGAVAPLIGRVSMDLITVDLGEVPAQIGDEVVLWGGGNPIEVVADFAGTIGYELTCSVTARVRREFI